MEDAELSRLLSDLATLDPGFESSLSAGGIGFNGRVGILADALPTKALQVSASEAVAHLLRVSILPRILETCRGEGSWHRGIWEFRIFKELHGHALVPQAYAFAGFKLGIWVKTVRARKLKGFLSKTEVKLLDSLGFVWDVSAYLWDNSIRRLEQYRFDHGHVLVPHQYRTPDGFNLGWWIYRNRAAKFNKILGQEQIKTLDDLGFVWDVRDHLWEQGFKRLQDYKTMHGHALVPYDHETTDSFKLGRWVSTQRAAKSKGKLGQEQMNTLDELGFVWDVFDHLWKQNINRLRNYKTEHGHALVPQDYRSSDGFGLGAWVKGNRLAKSKGKLGEEQMKTLDELGFVWDVLDHLWEQGINSLREYISVHGHALVPQDYRSSAGFKLGRWVSQKRAAKSKGNLGEEQMKTLDELGFIWDVLDHLWEQGISRLQEYKTEHGHALVPQGYRSSDGFKLGYWVNKKRMAKSKGTLGEQQITTLDKLGFVWDALDHLWEHGINRLQEYKTEHGHALVPQGYRSSDGFKLGRWVSQKRVAKSKGKLGEEQMKTLDELGFVWDILDHLWKQYINRLRSYKTEHGHVIVPKHYRSSDGFKLGRWVSNKRIAKSKGKLGERQIRTLDELGFVWDVLDHLWEQGTNRLQEYKREHGHALVPQDYRSSDGFNLGYWVRRNRLAKSKGKLGEEQMKTLDKLGFVWDVLDHFWEQGINSLREYTSVHGHALVPQGYRSSAGFKLGRWVSHKRMAKSKGKLGAQQIRTLDELGFVWDVLDHLWEQGTNRLQEYKTEHGHALVPQDYRSSDGFKLGAWVKGNRLAKSKGKLGAEQMKTLDELGFVWDVLDHFWEEGIKRLQEYKTEHGHALVPQDYRSSDGFKLGRWAERQVLANSRGILRDEQRKQLKILGWKWDCFRPRLSEQRVFAFGGSGEGKVPHV